MQVVRDPADFPRPPTGSAVTIGQYDGVHRGHQAVIGQVRELAAARALTTVLVTFDRHPATVVRPESAPLLLTDLDQKLELLEAAGVDQTLVLHFDEARSKERAEDFVTEVFVARLNARVVVVGEDFHFGHERSGNVDLLRTMGVALGFEVEPIRLVALDPGDPTAPPISSTAIRAALGDGRLDDATAMLGRHHEVRGIVVDGDRRGRDLGFPTANVAIPPDIQLPADGIYAGWYVRPNGDRHPTAISLGRRPTFYADADHSVLEAHLLDFDDELYGERARVEFVARLRGEHRFETVDALIAQMGRDCDETRRLLHV